MIFLKKLTTIVKFLNKTNKVQFVYTTVAFLENPVSIKTMKKILVFKCKTELGSDKYKQVFHLQRRSGGMFENHAELSHTLWYVWYSWLLAHSKPVLQPPHPNHCGNQKCTSKIQTPEVLTLKNQ